jgi:hypothetical protein
MKKNVAVIRSAGRTVGLISASICIIYVHFRSGSHSGLLKPRGTSTVRNAPGYARYYDLVDHFVEHSFEKAGVEVKEN